MALIETINSDLKQALKDREEQRVSTLRMLSAALKNKKIELQHELEDTDVLAVVKTQVKQLKDSLASFEEGGRADLIEKAKAELEILEKFMPEAMSSDELEAIVKGVIEEVDATSKSDMGKVMGLAMGKVAGKADGGDVKKMVDQLLS
jgi:uncharacterized protein